MSIVVMVQVWPMPMAPIDKLVLLKLADCASEDGSGAWPAVKTIAKHCGIHERTVQRSLRELEAAGYIEVQRPSNGTLPNVYRVRCGDYSPPAAIRHPSPGTPPPPEGGGGRQYATRGAAHRHPNRHRTVKEERTVS